MLTEYFVAATLAANKPSQQANAALKDTGIFLHEFQPQRTIHHGFKKSTVGQRCLAISDNHMFAAQVDKAVVNVYNREKGNQEATVPFPERIRSLLFANEASILIMGTESGKLVLWEVGTGRLSNSTASHLQAITSLCVTRADEYILSASPDSSIHVWSLPNLISFSKPTDYSNELPLNAPLRTFSSHRNPVTALTCGHSKSSTNFAISVSEDQTCYVWHIESCQILRTILLPSVPLCITIDPVDRAFYYGDALGRICSVDLWKSLANSDSTGGEPAVIQINEKDVWMAPSDQIGTTHCLTLSYDGTSLISGHQSGRIIQWDVAKRKLALEVTNLGQPVTNLQMLTPEGLRRKPESGCTVTEVVKPRLELSNRDENNIVGIPLDYTFHASLARSKVVQSDVDRQALFNPGFPDSMLDDALSALATGGQGSVANGNSEAMKVAQLQEEVLKLKQQLTIIRNTEEKRKERSMQRMAKREELGLKKREAYFEAKKRGKDGDAAMQAWAEKESMVDVESDDEHLGEGMDIS